MGKRLLVVRKNERSHSDHQSLNVEGRLGHRWIFVDDFIGGGTTRSRVIHQVTVVARSHRYDTEYVGSYLYSGTWDDERCRHGGWFDARPMTTISARVTPTF